MILEERVRKLEQKNSAWLVGKVAKLEKRLVELERKIEAMLHKLQMHVDADFNEEFEDTPVPGTYDSFITVMDEAELGGGT